MKKVSKISRNLFLVALISMVGCGVFSIHPLYYNEDLIVNDELIGIWQNNQDGDFIRIDTIADKKYRFLWYDEEDTIFYEAGLIKLDKHYFFDIFPYDDGGSIKPNIGDNMFRNYIPVHSFTKLDFGNNTLTMAEFDSKRLITLFKENKVRLAHELPEDEYVVITASTKDLQKFISRYADEEDAFNEPDTYTKVE